MFHIGLHFIIPMLVSISYWGIASFQTNNTNNRLKIDYKKVMLCFVIMMATMFVDIDHLLATPIYDPQRCSIHFHPLHSLWMMPIYVFLCIPQKTRWVGIGLCIHMLLDSADCYVNQGVWYTP